MFLILKFRTNFNFIFTLFIFLCIASSIKCSFYSASFYGDSLIYQKLTSLSPATNISFKFQTQSRHGLLLALASKEQYITVGLKNGRLKITLSSENLENQLDLTGDEVLDNLVWHQMNLYLDDQHASLYLNGQSIFSSELANIFHKMDFVFLGGYDKSVRMLFGNQSQIFYRGCLLDVQLNTVDMLYPLNDFGNTKAVINVKPGCSNDLRAQRNEVFSFLSTNAYSVFRMIPVLKEEILFECMIMTTNNSGLIFLNVDDFSNDFIGVELMDGRIQARVKIEQSHKTLRLDQSVNDGRWYRIRLKLKAKELELKVGRNKTKLYFNNNTSHFDGKISLKGSLFVGGVDQNVRSQQQDMFTSSTAFPGCIKKIFVNQNVLSFHDITASHDITDGCKNSQYFLLEASQPALRPIFVIPNSQKTINFNNTESSRIIKLHFSNTSDNSDDLEAETQQCFTIDLSSLHVIEGAEAVMNLTTPGLHQLIDHEFYSQNIFVRLVKNVDSGSLENNSTVIKIGDIFSISQLDSNQIHYKHSGDDSVSDQAIFEIISRNFSLCRQNFSSNYCKCQSHSIQNLLQLNILIQPVDDLPVLKIPTSFIFQPFVNIPTSLPIFSMFDPDSDEDQIIYHLLVTGHEFYLEDVRDPGRPISTFTHQRLLQGGVKLIYIGRSTRTRLLLRVSNNETSNEASETYIIRVESRTLTIKIDSNSEISLLEKEDFVLSKDEIFVTSNAGDIIKDFDISIMSSPRYGEIQLFNNLTNSWIEVDSFQYSHLIARQVRYKNIKSSSTNTTDSFSFIASKFNSSSRTHNINISIKDVIVTLETSSLVIREPSDTISLTEEEINVRSSPHFDDDRIQIVLISLPQLFVIKHKISGFELSINDTMTMLEVKSSQFQLHLIFANLHQVEGNRLEDGFNVSSIVDHKHQSEVQFIKIIYFRNSSSIKITNTPLTVEEGKEETILPTNLFAQNNFHKFFQFKVISGPSNGQLVQSNPETFTNRQISTKQIVYRHDGSETSSDVIRMQVSPVLVGLLPEQAEKLKHLTATIDFQIRVQLINDNSPVRTVDRPFNCVINSGRTITKHDLWFHDDDVTNLDRDLIIFRRGIGNGEIYNTSRPDEKLYEFTQNDIESNQVFFQHRGRQVGRFVFWVKDGRHKIPDLFVVRASDPFLKQTNKSEIVLIRGSAAQVNSSVIRYETNLDGNPDKIIYKLYKYPMFGKLVLNDCSSPQISNFTQYQVDQNQVFYCNHDKHSSRKFDGFNFTVTINDLSENNSVEISLRQFIQPATIRNHRDIFTHQNSSVFIHKSDLRVTHEQARPRDIVFRVISHPLFGHLILGSKLLDKEFFEFSQFDINQDLLKYEQDIDLIKDDLTPSDNVLFSVDVLGIGAHLDNLNMTIHIIPKLIPFRVSNYSVDEGKSRVLIPSLLNVATSSNARSDLHHDLTVIVVKKPKFGQLESGGKILNQFPLRLSLNEFVYYSHDNSESSEDSYQLQVVDLTNERKSRVLTQHVFINPIDDLPPTIINNTGLLVWTNSVTLLNNNHLSASDEDSSSDQLVFIFSPPSNGYFAHKTNQLKPINNFTQTDINNHQIVFIHQGGSKGGFSFQVTDHQNFGKKSIFVINCRPLVLKVERKQPVKMYPGSTAMIKRLNLNASTNDEEERKVIYVIIKKPTSGKLLIINSNSSHGSDDDDEIEEFTNKQIEEEQVFYFHNSPVNEWSLVDDFCVTATSSPAQNVSNICVNINITFDAFEETNRRSCLNTNKEIQVDEGANFTFTSAFLNASNLLYKLKKKSKLLSYIKYQIVKQPSYGKLFLNESYYEKRLFFNDSFTQDDINRGKLIYQHDDSENGKDEFSVDIYLLDEEQKFITNDSVLISVNLLNDNKPVLIKKAALLQVNDGFPSLITTEVLCAFDADANDQIIFEMIQPSRLGNLYLNSNVTLHFSQSDIEMNKVSFKQNNYSLSSGKVEHDVFYFGFSDLYHPSTYTSLALEIHPIKVSFTSKNISMKQGTFIVPITKEILQYDTNGDMKYLTFYLQEPFKAGNFLINNSEVRYFNPYHLMSGDLYYVMSNRTSLGDSANITLLYNDTRLNYQVSLSKLLSVNVDLSIQIQQNFTLNIRDSIILSTSMINCSELLQLTNTIASFLVIQKPKFAKFIKVQNETLKESHLFRFTDQDIAQNRIKLKAFDNISAPIQDSFLLKSYSERELFQTKLINIHFHISLISSISTTTISSNTSSKPNNVTENYKITKIEVSNSTTMSNIEPQKSNLEVSSNTVPLIWIVIGTILLILLLVISVLHIRYNSQLCKPEQAPSEQNNAVNCEDDFEKISWYHKSTNNSTIVKVTATRQEQGVERCLTAPVVVHSLNRPEIESDEMLIDENCDLNSQYDDFDERGSLNQLDQFLSDGYSDIFQDNLVDSNPGSVRHYFI